MFTVGLAGRYVRDGRGGGVRVQFRVHHDVQTGVERGGEAMRRKREGGEFHLGFLVWQEEKIVCFSCHAIFHLQQLEEKSHLAELCV